MRLEKRGLVDLARQAFSFPNARLEYVPQAQEQKALHHYLQFNFKVTLISEEKQEELAACRWMCRPATPCSTRRTCGSWRGWSRASLCGAAYRTAPLAGGGSEVSAATLQALLARAEAAVRQLCRSR